MGKIFICSIEKLTQIPIEEGHSGLGLAALPREVDISPPERYYKGKTVRFI